LESA
jgi:chromosome segregation ATPase